MYCSKCGSELPDNSVFCMSCGAKLKDLNREQSEGEQKTEAESIQEPIEKEIGQSIQPIEQMRSDIVTAEQASAEIAQLGQILEQAVKEKQAEKNTKWVRIRIDKKERSRLKRSITIVLFVGMLYGIFGLVCGIIMVKTYGVMATTYGESGPLLLIFLTVILIFGLVVMLICQLMKINTSDLYVSNIRCYGTDIHGKKVLFQLNEIVGVKQKKRVLKKFNYGFLSLCTTEGEYIFASRSIDIVFATFSKYLSEREKNR